MIGNKVDRAVIIGDAHDYTNVLVLEEDENGRLVARTCPKNSNLAGTFPSVELTRQDVRLMIAFLQSTEAGIT